MATTERTVIGVFDEVQSADRAISELQNAGFNNSRILHIDSSRSDEGGIFANLANIFRTTEPANTESPRDLTNDLEQAGVSQEEAEYYGTQYQNGKTLVTVNAGDRPEDARLILTTNGAHNYNAQTNVASNAAAEYDTNTADTSNVGDVNTANTVNQSTTVPTNDGTTYNPTAGVPDTGYADAATMGTTAGMTPMENTLAPDTSATNTPSNDDVTPVADQTVAQNNTIDTANTANTANTNAATYADTPAPTNQVATSDTTDSAYSDQNAGPLNTQNNTIHDSQMATDPNATAFADQNTEPLTNQAPVQTNTAYTNQTTVPVVPQNDATSTDQTTTPVVTQNDAAYDDDAAKRIATAKYTVSNNDGYDSTTNDSDNTQSFATNSTLNATSVVNNILGNQGNDTNEVSTNDSDVVTNDNDASGWGTARVNDTVRDMNYPDAANSANASGTTNN